MAFMHFATRIEHNFAARAEFHRISREIDQALLDLEGVANAAATINLVVAVTGKGLLRGLKLKIDPKPIQGKLRDQKKVLVGVAGDNVLRLAPPLNISEDEVRQAIDAIDAVLAAQMAEAGA